jgi:hypothetical protein
MVLPGHSLLRSKGHCCPPTSPSTRSTSRSKLRTTRRAPRVSANTTRAASKASSTPSSSRGNGALSANTPADRWETETETRQLQLLDLPVRCATVPSCCYSLRATRPRPYPDSICLALAAPILSAPSPICSRHAASRSFSYSHSRSRS